jgi:hypothetical protein
MDSRGTVTEEDFYRGKRVVYEEWFVNDLDLVTWARLRVFDDGTADAWEFGALAGFENEGYARHMIAEGHYVDSRELASLGEVPRCDPPIARASAAGQPFRYYGSW